MSSKFTVMLCVHRPPAMLAFAIESVLWQSHADFELFVVCDGAPRETIACAEVFAARDPRVRVFDFPKGERIGEAHRHNVLAQATGVFVAHIADDDLWFPDHLKELAALLADVEFGNLVMTTIAPDGTFGFHPGDLADPATCERMQRARWNFFGPCVAGYRLATYRRLPVGWSPAPPDVWSDLHMWRKFLRLDGISAGTRFSVQSISFRQGHRGDVTLELRHTESERWFKLICDPQQRARLGEEIWAAMARQFAAATNQSLMRNETIEEMNSRAKELKGQVLDRDLELARLREKMAVLDAELDRQRKRIVERDAELARRKNKIIERDNALARLRQKPEK